MVPAEWVANAAFVLLPGIILAVGCWLLVATGRRWLGVALVGVAVVFVGWSVLLFRDPFPRWLFELDRRWVWEWYDLYHDQSLMPAAAIFLPSLLVVAAAAAYVKGRRGGLVLIPMAFAPHVALALGSVICPDSQSGCGFTVALFGLGGIAVYLVGLVAAPFVVFPGEWPQRRSEESLPPSRDRRRLYVTVVAVSFAVFAGAVAGVAWWNSEMDSVPQGWSSRTYHPYPGSNGWVHILGVDANDHVWITAARVAGGPVFEYPELGRFDGDLWTVWTQGEGLPAGSIRIAAFPMDGSAWFAQGAPRPVSGTGGLGVLRYEEGQWTSYSIADGLGADWITAIAVSDSGIVIACTPERTTTFNGDNWQVSTHVCPPDAQIGIIDSPDGRRWESGRNGIYELKPDPTDTQQTIQSD